MGKKIVYKVVGIHPATNQLTSIWAGYKYQTQFALTYTPTEITKAPKGLAIFTFKNLESANRWASMYFSSIDYQIWKCNGNVCVRQEQRFCGFNIVKNAKSIKDLIAKLRARHDQPVDGTIFCSSITLLERIH